MDVFLLGWLEVRRDGQVIPASAWSRRKARCLFEFFLSPDYRAHMDQLLRYASFARG